MSKNEQILELARPYLQTRSNATHTGISRRFAEYLLEKESGDPEVVIPAVILHDVGWSIVPEEMQAKAFGPGQYDKELNRTHELEGVRIAAGILNQVHYDRVRSAEILQIIDGHDSRSTAISDSDKLVKDADKLFRFTVEGQNFYLARFQIGVVDILNYFNCNLASWFFTKTALEEAMRELAQSHWQIGLSTLAKKPI